MLEEAKDAIFERSIVIAMIMIAGQNGLGSGSDLLWSLEFAARDPSLQCLQFLSHPSL